MATEASASMVYLLGVRVFIIKALDATSLEYSLLFAIMPVLLQSLLHGMTILQVK